MEIASPLDCIDPNLVSMDLLGVDGNADMVYYDQSGTLASNSDLDVILDSITIPSHVRRDPSDRVWNTADQEENIRLLRRNSILPDFPFPPLANPSNNDNILATLAQSADSCLPPAKRRRKRRKAPLSEAEKEDRHRRFLERNRIAASKCREKKKNETERLEDRKIALGRENEALKGIIWDLRAEMRLLRDAVMSHASCNHPDVEEWGERNADFSAALDSFCESLVGEEYHGGGLKNEGSLDGGGSRKSSVDDTPLTLVFSEDGGPERSSMSSSTSSPCPPADILKDEII